MAAATHCRVFLVLFALFSFHCSAIHSEFIITHSPSYVHFLNSAGAISTSDIPKAVGLAMGFLPEKDMAWSGLAQGDPFQRPRANVLIAVESPVTLQPSQQTSYRLENQDDPLLEMTSVSDAVQQLFIDKEPLIVDLSADNTLFDLRSHHVAMFRALPATVREAIAAIASGQSGLEQLGTGSLDINNIQHQTLLAEIHVILEISKIVTLCPSLVRDAAPDVYTFTVSGLPPIVDKHGLQSPEVKDAVLLVEKMVDQITREYRSLYEEHVLVSLVRLTPASPGGLVRRSRSLLAEVTPTATVASAIADDARYNLVPVYDAMYPAAFNMILWFSILFALIVFAVSLGLWFMDPGRDSIIYRMTSQRMKKD